MWYVNFMTNFSAGRIGVCTVLSGSVSPVTVVTLLYSSTLWGSLMFKRWLPFLLFAFTLVGCLSESSPGQAVAEAEEKAVPREASAISSEALYQYARARLLAIENRLPEAVAALEKAIDQDPRSAYLRMIMAELQLARGDEKLARRAAEDALIQNPDYLEAHLLLANLLMNSQSYQSSIEHFERVVELDPSLENIYLQLAVAHVRLGDTDGAIGTLKRLLDQNPESAAGRLALARLYRQLGLTSLAEEVYHDFIVKQPVQAQGYAELAQLYKQLDKSDKALQILRRGMAANPSDEGFQYQLVRSMVELGFVDQALNQLRTMVAQKPGRGEAYRLLGLLLMEKKAWPQAAEAFQQLLVISPAHEQGLFYLGIVRENQSRWSEAMAAFEKVPAQSDFFLDATSHLGYLYYRDGQLEKAAQMLEERLSQSEGRPQLFTFLATLLLDQNRGAKAGDWLKKGIALFPESAELFYHRGLLSDSRGDRKAALADMRRAMELDDKHYEAMNFIAYSYAEQGENLEEALTLARKALELNNQGHILDTLGWVLFKMGRYHEARGELEAAAALLPEDGLVLEHLGDLYIELELTDKAAAVYRRALKQRPEDDKLRDKLQRLAPR